MSDRPLFQDADEQEAAYSGGSSGDTDVESSVVIPGAAAAGGTLSGQLGTTGAMGMGAAPAAGPVIAGLTHSPDEAQDDKGVIEDDETRQGR
jgi:hypothetical protein